MEHIKMEHIKNESEKKDFCTVCKKSLLKRSIAKHVNTKTHLGNIKKHVLLKKNLSPGTINNILRSTKIIEDIIRDKYKPFEINKIYLELREKYKISTSERIIRLGLINNKNMIFTEKQSCHMAVFLKNIQMEIFDNRDNNEKKLKNIKIDDIDDQKNDDDNIILGLYKIMPLRINEFLKLKILSTKNNNIELDKNYNYIIMNSNKLIFHLTKTCKYDEVDINQNIIEYMNKYYSYKIDNDKTIFNKSRKTFQRILKKTGYTSQQIRKIYSNTHDVKLSSEARLLNHSLGTHLSKYKVT